nr:hypothetical protein [Parashewanella spongiae]
MQAILKNHTAGDPMRQDLRWTNVSRRQISCKLYANGIPASKNLVSRLLRQQGFHRRKAQKTKTMKQHVDRNAQFEKLAQLKQDYLDKGNPS